MLTPLPDSLLLGGHPRRALIAAGVTDREVRGPLWTPVGSGRYAWSPTDATHPRQRIHCAASRLRSGSAVGGWAAAWLHDVRDLDGVAADGSTLLPVLVCTSPAHRVVPGTDMRVSRSVLDEADVTERDGVACTSPVRTAVDLGRLAPDLADAVAALDALVRHTGVSTEEVAGYADARRRWHGRRQLVRALQLVDAGAESLAESRLRVLWVVDAGLPPPLANPVILDDEGRPVARADLLDGGVGLVVEMDGEHHASAARRSADDERTQRLAALGLHVVRFTPLDLLPRWRARTVHRLRAARRYQLARPSTGRRWSVRAPPTPRGAQ